MTASFGTFKAGERKRLGGSPLLTRHLNKAATLSRGRAIVPCLSRSNGLWYPERPSYLPPPSEITECLVWPRIPIMLLKHLMHESQLEFVGQIVNVPVYVEKVVYSLSCNVVAPPLVRTITAAMTAGEGKYEGGTAGGRQ
ncbi:hypothetical protein HPB49_012818 [Dermacentor silvarum]|uniref:Uncharacterized protein n=1 Tax=Dermacentor silvarum TaxID=543639 RepID=A0ACB8C9G2_DERSI|nr:hypothetical protein HPB49_012818 [Dermacentor silvarum]